MAIEFLKSLMKEERGECLKLQFSSKELGMTGMQATPPFGRWRQEDGDCPRLHGEAEASWGHIRHSHSLSFSFTTALHSRMRQRKYEDRKGHTNPRHKLQRGDLSTPWSRALCSKYKTQDGGEATA